jgi:hypothetical protein
LGQRGKKEEKKSSFLRAKKSKKQKALKRRVKKDKRETNKNFSKTQILLLFSLLSLEKIHRFERRRRTHQEDLRRLFETRESRRER